MLRWLFGCMCSVDNNYPANAGYDGGSATYKKAGFSLFGSSSGSSDTTIKSALPMFDVFTMNPLVMLCYVIIIFMILVGIKSYAQCTW